MRWLFLFPALLLLFGLCSCRTGVTYDGEPCYALTESELAELVAVARASLTRPHRQLSYDDTRIIKTTAPEVKIHYVGDCSGEVRCRWQLPKKWASVLFKGLLNDPQKRSVIFEIVPIDDRIIYKGVPGRQDTKQ